jgi:hypothetical protein
LLQLKRCHAKVGVIGQGACTVDFAGMRKRASRLLRALQNVVSETHVTTMSEDAAVLLGDDTLTVRCSAMGGAEMQPMVAL